MRSDEINKTVEKFGNGISIVEYPVPRNYTLHANIISIICREREKCSEEEEEGFVCN
jgi:hypothetical protein